MPADLPALIAKLESADCRSRELSDEVLLACGWRRPDSTNFVFVAPNGDISIGVRRPDPTRSVDDAIALVPIEKLWSVALDEEGVAGSRSYLASLNDGYHDSDVIYGRHLLHPALALCAALLRALAHKEAV